MPTGTFGNLMRLDIKVSATSVTELQLGVDESYSLYVP